MQAPNLASAYFQTGKLRFEAYCVSLAGNSTCTCATGSLPPSWTGPILAACLSTCGPRLERAVSVHSIMHAPCCTHILLGQQICPQEH